MIKGAYYPSWDESLGPAGIQTRYFTHIFYAFLNPEDGTFIFNITDDEARKLQTFTSTLRAKQPPVKTLFAVGGASAGTAVLSRMASKAQSRAAFIRSSIQVARRFGFDGIDLDWEYPENQTHMDNFGTLLKKWRKEVQKEATTTGRAPLLLTAAVYYAAVFPWGAHQAYPAASIKKNLDFINVMTYDYYGDWDTTATGAHAALYDPSPAANVSGRAGLESWTRAGLPPRKLVMGVPLYGRTWTLANPSSSGIGARAVGVGRGEDGGILSYAQVVRYNRDNNARVEHDGTTVSVYSVAGNHWISYDDAWSVRRKIEYARSLGLGGYFFWDVCGDDQWIISRTASETWPA
ncbi:hypothetical protein C2S53_004850 [Perilla frutescens var. hirtella]|uniref:GH18 domain-containing protein n=1 Tax=Perilla frutescens var. hirtella TaxID=608512 RepID=A0AAD4JJ39_PERFH|nr:hypothetical protein C2S53_004850 [Perilla frutescens var. hirtella]